MSAILLDTHVWIWFINGSQELQKPAQKRINAAIQQQALAISAISLWEITMLQARKRIVLDTPCLEWINKSLKLTRAQVLPLTPAIAVESCCLPGDFHANPADSMIVATARVQGLTLLTRDSKILAYSDKRYVSVVKV